jgi:hypothetical protein
MIRIMLEGIKLSQRWYHRVETMSLFNVWGKLLDRSVLSEGDLHGSVILIRLFLLFIVRLFA